MNNRPASYPEHQQRGHGGGNPGGQYNGGPANNGGPQPRSAWANSGEYARAVKLPPLEGEHVQRSIDGSDHLAMALAQAQAQLNQGAQMEPLNLALSQQNMALSQQGRQQAAMEERLAYMEQRLGSTERMGSEVSRAFDIQNQRVGSMGNDLSRASAELNDLRLRYEGAVATNNQLQNQVMAFSADLRQQDTKVTAITAQLGESLRMNAELRGQIAMMGDELHRAAADRSAASMGMERLARQFQEGTSMLAEEGRRAVEEANAAYRAESQRRQQQHLADLAILNREVDAYRQEATNAGAQLHSAVQSLNSRLQSEEAQLDRLRAESAAIANSEAGQLGTMRGQIGELQNLLNGMGQQLQAEQGMRKSDAQAFDYNLKSMESAMMEAQDAVVKRTVGLMESKAQQFMKLIQELEGLTSERDEETRVAGEQAMTAVVRTNARKEKAGLERLLVLESGLRDVANAAAQSLVDLQTKLDQGLSELATMSEVSKRGAEDREGALREQVNAALQKICAYARDMEESLDQERLRLEEVVKMEIKSRIQATEALRQEATGQMAAVRGEMKEQSEIYQKDLAKLRSELHDKVMKEMREEIETKLEVMNSNLGELASKLTAEERSRKQSVDQLHQWFAANAAEAKLAEELLHSELDALSAMVSEQKRLLEEEIVEKVGALRGDVEKLRAKLKSDRKDHEALDELVQVHTEVFVDVQKKLDSLFQKTKTQEVQLKNMYEETGEKLSKLEEVDEANKKEAKKALEAAKMLLATQLSEVAATAAEDLSRAEEAMGKLLRAELEALASATKDLLEAQDEKMARAQTVLEDIIAQVQEDTAKELETLGEKVTEQQAMLEDEIARLEEDLDTKTDALQQEVSEKLKASEQLVTTRLAESEVKVTGQLVESAQKLATLDAETKLSLEVQKEATLAAIASLEELTSASLAGQKAELSEQLASVEKGLAEQLDSKVSSMKISMEAQKVELEAELSQQREAASKAATRLDAELSAQKAELEQKMAESAARLDSLSASVDQKLEEAAASATSQMEGLQSAVQDVTAQIHDTQREVQAQLVDSAAQAEEKLNDVGLRIKETQRKLEAQENVIAGQMDTQAAQLEAALSGINGDLQSMRDAVSDHTQELANVLEDVSEMQGHSKAAAESAEQVAGLETRLEQMAAHVDEAASHAEGARQAMDSLSTKLSEVESIAKNARGPDESISRRIAEVEDSLLSQRQSMEQRFDTQKAVVDQSLSEHKAAVDQQMAQQMDTQKATVQKSLSAQKAAIEQSMAEQKVVLAQQIEQVKDTVAAGNASGSGSEEDLKALKDQIKGIEVLHAEMEGNTRKVLASEMEGALGQKVRAQAVSAIEKTMHMALDEAMVQIKSSLHGEQIKPLQDDIEHMKEMLHNMKEG